MRWLPALGLLLAACSDVTDIGELRPGLELPRVVDFGDVRLGEPNARDVVLKNTGAAALVLTFVPGDGFSAAEHAFSISPLTLSLEAGQSAPITAAFQAFRVMVEPAVAQVTIATNAKNADGTPFTATLELRGRGTTATLLVEPNPVDFGTVLLGSSHTVEVRLTNQLGTPMTLRSAADAMGRPLVTPAAGFVILAEPALFTLAGGESRMIEARYTPAAAASDRARWVVSTCDDPICDVAIELVGQGSEGALACAPAAIDFGAVNPGRTAARVVRCTNVASDPIELTSWSLDPNSAAALTAAPFVATTLMPGAGIDVDLRLTPSATSLGEVFDGTLIVRGRSATTMDGISPVRVPLHGTSGGPRIAVLPPALSFGAVEVGTRDRRAVAIVNEGYGDLTVTVTSSGSPDFSARSGARLLPAGTATVVSVSFLPSAMGRRAGALVLASNDAVSPAVVVPLTGDGVTLGPCAIELAPTMVNFGLVDVGDRATRGVTLTNTGRGTCLVNHAQIATGTTSFSVVTAPTMIAAGASSVIEVAYAPRIAGNTRGVLELYVSDPAASLRVVPLAGTGFGEVQVSCPPPSSVAAGAQVSLEAIATSRSGTISDYLWEIVAAPVGGIGTPNQWTPDPPAASIVLFRPYLVGRYGLRVTVGDTNGNRASCTTDVTAVGHGLRVELTWDGLGDVDLHLHDANQTPWFGRGTTFGVEDDCFYANCSQQAVVQGPLWDPNAPTFEGRNPGLDFDNIVGFGPENIHVDDVRAGDSFTVALHYFWDHGHGPRIATANVYCGSTAVPTATFTSTTMIGLDQGGCTQNTFWKVATLTFTSSSACTVTPLGIYQPGADACASF